MCVCVWLILCPWWATIFLWAKTQLRTHQPTNHQNEFGYRNRIKCNQKTKPVRVNGHTSEFNLGIELLASEMKLYSIFDHFGSSWRLKGNYVGRQLNKQDNLKISNFFRQICFLIIFVSNMYGWVAPSLYCTCSSMFFYYYK